MSSSPPQDSFDRNLYFGVLAIRHGYIRSEDFFTAARLWKEDRSRSIGDVLVDMDALESDDRDMFDRTLDEDLAATSSVELKRLFETVGPLSAGFELALRRMKDPAIDAALDRLSSMRTDRSGIEARFSEPMVSDCSIVSQALSDETEPDLSDDEIPIPRFTYLDPPDAPDTLGMLGSYRIARLLGEGAYGTVFLGFDTRLHRNVAVKVLKPSVGDSAPSRRRFLREARAGAQVDHPNVVRVYGVEEKPLPFLIMECVDGETLHERIKRIGRIPLPDVIEFSRQLAEGIAAAHDARLVHRDIKPANVMIAAGPQPIVKITDFGLVRVTYEACISESDEIHGTPVYMSPEQAKGRSTISFVSDLFSLGSVIYTMTTGQPPFEAASTMAILRKVMYEHPRPIQEFAPDTPVWFVDLVSRLMSKRRTERAQRIGSARNVAKFLKRKQAELDSGEMPAPRDVPVDPLDQDTIEFENR